MKNFRTVITLIILLVFNINAFALVFETNHACESYQTETSAAPSHHTIEALDHCKSDTTNPSLASPSQDSTSCNECSNDTCSIMSGATLLSAGFSIAHPALSQEAPQLVPLFSSFSAIAFDHPPKHIG